MIEIADSIKAFLPAAQQADFVLPSEQIFVLTGSQLQEIIAEATKPLILRLEALEDRITQPEGDKAKFEALVKDMDSLADNQLNQLRLIADLRKDKEPQPLQKDRGEILRALLVANDGKMLAKEARQKMCLSRSAFSVLLSTMKYDIETKPYHLHKNWLVLVLR